MARPCSSSSMSCWSSSPSPSPNSQYGVQWLELMEGYRELKLKETQGKKILSLVLGLLITDYKLHFNLFR